MGRVLLTLCSTYKGSKIEWDNDECAAPIDRPLHPRKESIPTKKKDAPLMNRFQLLNMDGSEDRSDDENDTSGITITTTMTSSTIGLVA